MRETLAELIPYPSERRSGMNALGAQPDSETASITLSIIAVAQMPSQS
jgi:hypothetical protein